MKKQALIYLISIGLFTGYNPLFAQIVNIPDANFKAVLVGNSNINTNLDGEIQQAEAIAFDDTIAVASSSISNLTGIEEFVNIIQLSASGNLLSGTVDLSSNVDLKRIFISNNSITSLVLPATNQLQMIVAEYNDLTSLDISANPNLTTLWSRDNTTLVSINASNNPNLGSVDCRNCGLTSLDLSSSNNLQNLHAENNFLTSIILPTTNNLYQLYINNNQLTTLDLGANSNLNYVYCNDNLLTSLVLPSSSAFLNYVFCQNNNLTCLDLSGLTTLFQVNCSNNNLQTIDIKNTNSTSISNPNFNAINNPSLTCVQVDDSTYSASTWTNIPAGAYFSTNCGLLPVAGFTTDADSCFGTPVNFTDLSTNTQNWVWNMNNIDTLYISNPIYTFPSAGYYHIELTASNCYGSDYEDNFIAVGRKISGAITSTLGTLGLGDVYLFKYQPVFTAFDTVAFTVFQPGSFDLGVVAQGDYILKMIADPVTYPSLIPTYFGDKWSWDSATVIHHTCTADYVADVNILDQITISGGSGTLAGVIVEGQGFGRAQGDPIHGVDVKLGITSTGQIVGCTETDTNGEYGFTNLPFNNYTIYADIPGLERDSSYQVILDTTNSQYLNLNYIVDSTSIYIIETTGINNQQELELVIGPNPSAGGFHIYGYELVNQATLNIYDITGKLLSAEKITTTGQYIEPFLKPGTYFIELIEGKSIYRQKLIRQ